MKLLKILILLALSFNCMAGVEYRKFNDPVKEKAYRVLIEELRCLVCQNQTIADSNAALAQDLRRQVYEMLQQGNSRDEIVDFMIKRYGDFVLYNPQFKAKTGVLWLGPIIFLLIGLVVIIGVVFNKRKKVDSQTAESDENKAKRAKVKKLLSKGDLS